MSRIPSQKVEPCAFERQLQEVELYAFESTIGTFHLTPHEFDVVIDGQHYERCQLERNALAQGAEAAKSALELTLPPDHALVRHLLQAAITGEATAVHLRLARSDGLDYSWWLVGTRWMGRVLGVEVADDAARIRCESAQVSLKRIGLRRLYSRACSLAKKGVTFLAALLLRLCQVATLSPNWARMLRNFALEGLRTPAQRLAAG